MTNTKACPLVAYEFAATQLILRANGFKTSELKSVLIPTDEKETTVILQIKRKDLGSRLVMGTLPITCTNATKLWFAWQEAASANLLAEFTKFQRKLAAFKNMEETLEFLSKAGFTLMDSPIIETVDKMVN